MTGENVLELRCRTMIPNVQRNMCHDKTELVIAPVREPEDATERNDFSLQN